MVLDKPRQSSKEGINQQRDKAVKERRGFLYGHRDQNDQTRPINIEEKLTHVLPDIRMDLENLRQQEISPVGYQSEILVQRERQVNQIIESLAQLGTELKDALQKLERKSPEEQKWDILKKLAANSIDSKKNIKSDTDSLDPKKIKDMQQFLDVLLESAKCEKINIEAYKYIIALKNENSRYGIERFDISADVDKYVQTLREMKYNLKYTAFSDSLKQAFREKNPDEQTLKLRYAANFYYGMIKPLQAKGKGVFTPRAEYIDNLCNKLVSNEGANIVLYFGLVKMQSLLRTGSPDTVIDMPHIELLRQYALMAKTAKNLGLNLHFTIVDEGDALPRDDILGFNDKKQAMNIALANAVIKGFEAEGLITIRSLKNSIAGPLGDIFSQLYKEKRNNKLKEIQEAINNKPDHPLNLRACILIDAIPGKGLAQFGITSSEDVAKVRKMTNERNLKDLPENLSEYVVSFTADFEAYLGLRSESAKAAELNNKVDEYPEYHPNRIRAGITRSSERLSLLPSFKKFESRTVLPLHGLAVYTESSLGKQYEYAGIAQYRDLQSRENIEIVRLKGKPIFAVQHASNEIGISKSYE